MNDARRILETSRSVVLIDWPHPGVPRALLEAGLAVISHTPDGYFDAALEPTPPGDVDPASVFPPASGETGYLVLRPREGRPSDVDVACVYRPSEELPEIVLRHVVPLGAKVLWLQAPITSSGGLELAREHGLAFVDGLDIAELARGLRAGR